MNEINNIKQIMGENARNFAASCSLDLEHDLETSEGIKEARDRLISNIERNISSNVSDLADLYKVKMLVASCESDSELNQLCSSNVHCRLFVRKLKEGSNPILEIKLEILKLEKCLRDLG